MSERHPGHVGGDVVYELPYPRARLAAMIRQLMQDEFVEKEPTPECFDYDEERSAALLAFVGGQQDERVRKHLLACCRCRFIFAVAHKDGEQDHP